jgi:hypothetical protein
VGYGWSTKERTEDAVKEAITSATKTMEGVEPEYVIVFSSIRYDSKKLLKEVRKLVGSRAQIYGGTSCVGVITRDGIHKNGLTIMLIASRKISFGVGGIEKTKTISPQKMGKQAILQAIKNARKERKDKPDIILTTPYPGEEEKIIEGIKEVVGAQVPIIGGSSGDNEIKGEWRQFCNDKVFKSGISLTAIYSDVKIGWAYESGYITTKHKGIVTKAKGRTIYEIDNRPAALVYNEWTDGAIIGELKGGRVWGIIEKSTFYPLAKIFRGKGGEIYNVSIHPLSVNGTDKSLDVFADVEKGEELMLLHGNWEILLNRSVSTPQKALLQGKISPEDVAFGIWTFCAGTMLVIPEDELPKMPLLINDVVKNCPWIGTFTFGEQGFLIGVGPVHGNLVSSMVVFAKE